MVDFTPQDKNKRNDTLYNEYNKIKGPILRKIPLSPELVTKAAEVTYSRAEGKQQLGVTYTTNSEVVMMVKHIPFGIAVK